MKYMDGWWFREFTRKYFYPMISEQWPISWDQINPYKGVVKDML
jgi:hypothetical protein